MPTGIQGFVVEIDELSAGEFAGPAGVDRARSPGAAAMKASDLTAYFATKIAKRISPTGTSTTRKA